MVLLFFWRKALYKFVSTKSAWNVLKCNFGIVTLTCQLNLTFKHTDSPFLHSFLCFASDLDVISSVSTVENSANLLLSPVLCSRSLSSLQEASITIEAKSSFSWALFNCSCNSSNCKEKLGITYFGKEMTKHDAIVLYSWLYTVREHVLRPIRARVISWLYIYVYVYVYVYVYTYIYIYIYTYMHTYIHTCTHTYIHTYIHTYKHALELDFVVVETTNQWMKKRATGRFFHDTSRET